MMSSSGPHDLSRPPPYNPAFFSQVPTPTSGQYGVTSMDQPIAVWEVGREDYKGWQLYPGDVSCFLEESFKEFVENPAGKNIAKLTETRIFDFAFNEEVDQTNNHVYPIRRLEMSCDCALAQRIVWKWGITEDGNTVQWNSYCAEVVNLLERKFCDNEQTVNLQQEFPHLDMEYSVDFLNMMQINNHTKTPRRISRVKLQDSYPKALARKKETAPESPAVAQAMQLDVVRTAKLLGYDDMILRAVVSRRLQQNGMYSCIEDLLTDVTTESTSLKSFVQSNPSESRPPTRGRTQEDRSCKICMDNQADVAFVPCGHFCCCSSCAKLVRNCPMCRKTIQTTMRIYM